MKQLVLSLFPGADLLGKAFELEGFTVVKGPDVVFGSSVRDFNPPTERFDGVIGGPPCQAFSQMKALQKTAGRHGNLVPEFERVVAAANPNWFLMECVKQAPIPSVDGYIVTSILLNNCWLGEEQNRLRRFTFGSKQPHAFRVFANQNIKPKARTVSAGHGAVMSHERGNLSIAEMCRLQGLDESFLSDTPFTAQGKRKLIGNGVPIPMGRAIARAVKEAIA
jgi:DNA (cytosine-5)-methyltransferase 1